MNHTPGPWKVRDVSWSEDGNARYELDGIKTVSTADALLIEAAPDLLAALEPFALLPVGEKFNCHSGITDMQHCSRCAPILAARMAIDKASRSATEQPARVRERPDGGERALWERGEQR